MRDKSRFSIKFSIGEFITCISCLTPGLDWTRLFMSLTAGAGTRCMSLLPQSPTLWLDRKRKKTPSAHASSFGGVSVSLEVFVGVFWLSSRLRTRRHSRSETKRRSLRSQSSRVFILEFLAVISLGV